MKSKHILIVEANEQERKLLNYLVGQLCSVETTDSEEEALLALSARKVDLVLLSLDLSDSKGLHFMKKIQTISPSCIVVATSAGVKEADKALVKQQGFADFFPKPVRPKEFILGLQQLLTGIPLREEQGGKGFPYFEPIDQDAFNQLLKYSSPALVKELYTAFAQECIQLAEELESIGLVSPNEEMLRAIHTIKGNSGTLGAGKIYSYAKNCESIGRQGMSVEFTESLPYLKEALHEFYEFLLKEPSLYDAR